jgi:hypothetical protein
MQRIGVSGNRGTVKTVPYGDKQSRGCIRITGCTAEQAHRHFQTGAIARHGRRPGTRTVMRKARIYSKFRRMGFQREGRLCKKPFPLACLSSDSFRTSGKNRPPEGRTSQRIPPGYPGRPAAPAQKNDTRQKPPERSKPFPAVRAPDLHPSLVPRPSSLVPRPPSLVLFPSSPAQKNPGRGLPRPGLASSQKTYLAFVTIPLRS